MTSLLILSALPLAMAALGLFPRTASWLPTAASFLMILQLAVAAWQCLPALSAGGATNGGFALDGIGAAFAGITTLVAAAAIVQSAFLLPEERKHAPISERRFCLYYTLAGLFIASMYAVVTAQNLGYMWIALEATTLMSAPLVDFHHTKSSLEASWKYLLLCSVGIALAFLGTLFLFAAQHGLTGTTLSIPKLLEIAPSLDPRLVHVGFALCILGYGTKAGLFPLHSWLPDAHSEAPAPVSAMLSGALLNCAVVGIWRVTQIVGRSGQSAMATGLLIPAGTLTVLAAAIMLIRQHDLKRMWAYSSVEHVGILVVAVGLFSGPLLVLHALNHSLSKTALFLMSGNVQEAFRTKSLSKLGGVMQSSAAWGIVLFAAGLAIAGSPPFGTFVSEFLVLRQAVSSGQAFAAVGLVTGLTVAFLAIFSHLAPVVLGSDRDQGRRSPRRWATVPAALMALSLLAGIATPGSFASNGAANPSNAARIPDRNTITETPRQVSDR